MRLSSALVLSNATVTTAAAAASAAATSSSAAVIIVALDPTDVVVSSSSLRWDKTNDANDMKYAKKEERGSELGGVRGCYHKVSSSSSEKTKMRYLRREGGGHT